jgi:tRNA dimethylallyltransferase
MNTDYNLITVLGATAGGKTSFAAALAYEIGAEIISADSRQVYRGMDIGTGKDLDDYIFKEKKIPYHLIDIADAGYKYNVFEYQQDFLNAFNDIHARKSFPVLCGGTGMYIEAVLQGYRLIRVPKNEELRKTLKEKSDEELIQILKQYKDLHNISDTSNRKRLIRAVEIAVYSAGNPDTDISYPKINSLNFQIVYDRRTRRERISQRLKERIDEGMVEETKALLDAGVPHETLLYYGLEYKYVTEYLMGNMSFEKMLENLEIAIHQFSKRQMTWFRKMERSGTKIHKIDGNLPPDKKVEHALSFLMKNP